MARKWGAATRYEPIEVDRECARGETTPPGPIRTRFLRFLAGRMGMVGPWIEGVGLLMRVPKDPRDPRRPVIRGLVRNNGRWQELAGWDRRRSWDGKWVIYFELQDAGAEGWKRNVWTRAGLRLQQPSAPGWFAMARRRARGQ